MTKQVVLTHAQRKREAAWVTSLISFLCFIVTLIAVSAISGSQTMEAELVRMLLMFGVEALVFTAMRMIHRGRFDDFEFGHGKIEQLANFGLAISFALGALAILTKAVYSMTGDPNPIPPLGMAIAAVYQAASVIGSLYVYLVARSALAIEANAVAEAQCRLYHTRLMASCVLLVVITIAALTVDSLVAHWLDVSGAVFVALIMLRTAVSMLRGGLPDLLDRGLDQAAKDSIHRVLEHHLTGETKIRQLRTRRSSGRIFVQLEILSPATKTLAEIDHWRSSLKASLLEVLGNCDVTIQVESNLAEASA